MYGGQKATLWSQSQPHVFQGLDSGSQDCTPTHLHPLSCHHLPRSPFGSKNILISLSCALLKESVPSAQLGNVLNCVSLCVSPWFSGKSPAGRGRESSILNLNTKGLCELRQVALLSLSPNCERTDVLHDL